MPEVSLVIPVFDERDNLQPLHAAIVSAIGDRDFEAIYVNDGSTDGSTEVLNALAESDDRVRVLHFTRNYGQTAALRAGLRHTSADVIVTLDADLQNDPADIPMLLAELEENDVACGWRKSRKDAFLTRTFPSRVANALISKLSKVPLHDYGCTLRAYRAEFIRDVPLYGEMHRFIPIYVTWAGARLTEVPVRHHPRKHGESKYGLSRVFKVLLDLTTLKFLRDFFITPIYFFGWVGLLLALAGLFCGAAAIGLTVWGDWDSLALGLALLSPLLMIFGAVEVTLGIIAEVLIRMHHELQAKEPYKIRESRNLSVDSD